MKKLHLILAFSVLTLSNTVFAQGGDNCAAAFASPIVLPLNTVGNTCAALNDIQFTGAPCLNAGYQQGPDWIYYFCSTQTGQVQVVLTGLPPTCFASISIWSGCPNAGNCVGASVTQTGTSMACTVPVINGNCYYIVIDNWPLPTCITYNIGISYVPPVPAANPSCTNVDFETGNFTGWYGTDGYMSIGMPAAPYPIYNQASTGLPSANTIITSGPGLDPCAPIPVVCPTGGNFSCALGNGPVAGYGGATLQQKFMVSAANANFTYNFAVVVMDAGHLNEEQPYFLVDMYDQNGNIISCAHYLVVGGPNIPGFFVAGCFVGTYYQPWTAVNIDLTAYISQAVTIKFTVGDCSQGAHFCYAYVDCSCQQFQIIGNDSICVGQSTTLTAPAGSGNYLWSPGGQTTQSITVSPVTMPYQIYTCTLTSLNNPNCFSTITDTVFVFPVPSASFTAVTVGTCSSGTATVTNSSTGGNTYSWTWGDLTSSTLQNPPPHTYTPAGTYTITLYVTTPAGCSDTITQVVSFGGPSTVSAFNATTVCLNNPTVFTDASTGGPTSWQWNFGEPPSGPNNTSNLQNPTHTYLTPGTFTVTLVTDAGNPLCGDTIIITVTVIPLPVPLFVATSVCVGFPTVFTDQSTTSSGVLTGWAWNFGDPASGPANLSALQNPTHIFSAAGTYTVILTVTTSNGCQNTVSFQVIVTALPVAAFSNSSVCVGIPTNFTDLSTVTSGQINQWAWTFGDGNISSLQNPSNTYIAAGTYTVTLVVTTTAGCTATISQQVTVDPLPVPAFTADDTDGCVIHCVQFTDLSTISSGTITQWSWNFGDGNTSTQQNPNHCYVNAGTYTVSLTVTSGSGCSATFVNVAYIIVYPFPVAEFTASPNPATVVDPTVFFTDLSQGNPVSWTWSFGDGTPVDYTQNPSHAYPNNNTGVFTYTVMLIISNQWGCVDTVWHDVVINPEYTFYAPNCITPTDDGNNDLFFTYGVGWKEYHLWIFDRWGNLIFETDNKLKGWDGKVEEGKSKEIVQEDTYVWKVKILDVFDKNHQYVGHVSVIK